MNFFRFLLNSSWVLFVATGCALFQGETPPTWLISPQKAFPAEQFLTGVGEGSSRDQAEKRAYAALARIFLANVQAHSMDQESYSIQESSGMNRTQRTLQLDQRTQVTTSKVLENVRILDAWYQPSNRHFFALAGMNRQQAEQATMERIRNWDLNIGNMVQQGRTHTEKIQRIRGYKQAIVLLQQREQLNADLRVIRTSGASQPSLYRRPEIEREFQNFVTHEVTILISINGDSPEEMERAILEKLKQEGLPARTASSTQVGIGATYDLSIVGHTQLWSIDIPDPLFKYVRWCGDIDIYEHPSQQLIGVISEAGREGHVTEQEANVRANGAMQQVLGREVVRLLTKSFNQIEEAPSETRRVSHACPQ